MLDVQFGDCHFRHLADLGNGAGQYPDMIRVSLATEVSGLRHRVPG